MSERLKHAGFWQTVLLPFAALLIVASCSQQATPTPAGLAGGVLAAFEVEGMRFHVWVTNATTIQQILDLQAGKSEATIPNGRILRGPGQASHNAPWSWHLDPEDIEMAEVTMELCDGTPAFVEESLSDFVDNIKRYCPWGARLVAVKDYR